jgi:hypothetical protein
VETSIHEATTQTKVRWENDIKNDLIEIKLNDWRICIQHRNKWKGISEKAKLSIYEAAAHDEGEEEYCACTENFSIYFVLKNE